MSTLEYRVAIKRADGSYERYYEHTGNHSYVLREFKSLKAFVERRKRHNPDIDAIVVMESREVSDWDTHRV